MGNAEQSKINYTPPLFCNENPALIGLDFELTEMQLIQSYDRFAKFFSINTSDALSSLSEKLI